jgi:hypothetical protein
MQLEKAFSLANEGRYFELRESEFGTTISPLQMTFTSLWRHLTPPKEDPTKYQPKLLSHELTFPSDG